MSTCRPRTDRRTRRPEAGAEDRRPHGPPSRQVAALLLALLLVAGCGSPSRTVAGPSGAIATSPPETVLPSAPPSPSPSGSAAPSPSALASSWPVVTTGPSVTVPVLYYHRVLPIPAEYATWTDSRKRSFLADDVLPWALAAQLDRLQADGYTTILPRDLAAHWDGGVPLPARPVILTFDDGYAEWASTLLPMLQARGMVAEFYITSSWLEDGRFSAALARQLADAGMGIGAHDVDHVQLAGVPGQAPATPAVMRFQVTEARRALEAALGVPVDSMAYVGGGFDAELVSIVRAAGYLTARSIVRGVIQSPAGRWTLHVSKVSIFDDVIDPSACEYTPSEATCAVRLPLQTFAQRLSGAAPG